MDLLNYVTAVGFEQITLDSVKGLTTTLHGTIPITAVHVTVTGQPARYTYDGTTPTTSLGHYVAANGEFWVLGPENVKNLRMLQTAATAVANVTKLVE